MKPITVMGKDYKYSVSQQNGTTVIVVRELDGKRTVITPDGQHEDVGTWRGKSGDLCYGKAEVAFYIKKFLA